MKNEQESWSAEKKNHEALIVSQEKEYKDKLRKLEEKLSVLVRVWVFN